MNADKVYDVLKQLSIAYETLQHEAVFTVEEMKKALPNIDGHGCKNLFLRDQKGKQHFLVVMPEDKPFNLGLFSEKQGLQKMSFASEQRLMKYLGVTPGSVSPFGLINDDNAHVIVYVDAELGRCDKVCFHPNDNTATVIISSSDLKKYFDSLDNDISWIEL